MVKQYYVDGEGERLFPEHELQTWIVSSGKTPEQVDICPQGEAEWKPATEYGFKDTTAF